ncbi:hypothetical protein HanRHA438_Chr01g0005451 [Helianthus annuus]|uniref:Uncharacterized protein n=1 Tax=Helianthus annuus TaxID=4232 RepID=A0A9K3P383_HELAN|nr:hypothetical protein HanXRQr2_Chr01g0004981 [Helianthus annuus]KAJ0610461.1 hypothetical protein HanHA300_Chr01g0003981 [Helianthus annuus]KAJ0625705.1 hypothetical protein HanHA89_Chr01g0004611 [Helianthus annuus]KAJ0782083.1 hypothetical protein HanLR1_Chr01g0004041 [Helianthus annuus]KAJ0946576.1 hypothetical protein HanRHA438_Chr01g0005451 [Helianthus annuus]
MRLLNSSLTAVYAGVTSLVNTLPESMMVPAPLLGLRAKAVGGMLTSLGPTLIPMSLT